MSGAVTPILEIKELAPTQIDKIPAINDMAVNLEAAFNAQLAVSMAAGDVALSFTQFARNQVFVCNGQTAARKLVIPLTTPTGHLPAYRVFLVRNQSTAWGLNVGGATGSMVTIAPSSSSMLQSDGVNVIAYGGGGAGAPGGAVTILYTFNSSTAAADPGSGQIAFNNSTQNAATTLYMSETDFNGSNWAGVLDSLPSSSAIDGQIRLFETGNAASWIVFNMTAMTDSGTYRQVTVTPVGASSANPFGAGDVLGFAFSRTGDSGAPVLTTVNTWGARQHTPLVTLTDAATIAVDFGLGNQYTVRLAGNRILGNPSNCLAGDNGQILVQQDGTGGRTLTYGSSWFPLGGLAGTLSSSANAYDLISYFAVSSTHVTFSIANLA